MSKLRKLIAPIIADAGEKTFVDYMIPFSNSGEIYEPYFAPILEAALEAPHDPEDVYEIIVPIASEILSFIKRNSRKFTACCCRILRRHMIDCWHAGSVRRL